MNRLSRATAALSWAVSRLCLPKQTIAVTQPYLSWLGFEFQEVIAALRWADFRVLPVPAPTEWTKSISMQSCPPILQDALRYAVAVQTEETLLDLDFDCRSDVQLWSARLGEMFTQVKEMLRQSRPALVVLVQGYEPVNAVARAAALDLGIPVLAVENTALKSRMLWDNVSAITTNRNLAANYYWRYKGSVSDEEVNQFIQELKSNFINSKSDEHSVPIGASAPECDRPNVLFLGQVLTDSSVIFGLKTWQSPLDVMEATVQWCQRSGYRLLVKLHPKESKGKATITDQPYNRLTYRKMQERPQLMNALRANQALVDKNNTFDTYALIDQSKITVTINSQSGLEAALLGKPTVVCGDSFYRGFGFTLDVNCQEEFEIMMDYAKDFRVPYSADQFAFIFYERYCRPKTVTALVSLIKEQVRKSR